MSAGVTEIGFADSLHGLASGYSEICGTKDGGITWEEQACVRAGEFMRGLNVFAPNHAYILLEDGLYEYNDIPDTIKLCGTSKSTAPDAKQEKLFSIYPNPSSNVIKIQWNGPESSELTFALFNAQGIEMLRWSFTETEHVSLSEIPPGLYFLQAAYPKTSRWIRAVEKMVVVR